MTRLCVAAWAVMLLGLPAWTQTGLTVIPQQVTLTATAGSSAPATQTVTVSTTPPNYDFVAAVRYLAPASGWLTVSPLSGKTPAALVLSANAANLTAGTYLAQVTVAAGALGTVVNVTFAVGSNQGAIVADPTGLTFFDQSLQPNLITQTVNLAPGGQAPGPVSYTATASSAGNWLSVAPFLSMAPGVLPVSVSTTGLQAGIYTGTVTIIPVGGAPTVIPVTLSTLGTSSPTSALTLTQTKISFNYQTRSTPLPAPPQQTIGVAAGTAGVSFTATASASWIQLSSDDYPDPSSSVTGTAPGNVFVAVDPTGLAQGVHTGSIVFQAEGFPDREITVELTVAPNVALNADPSSVVLDDVANTSATLSVSSTNSAAVTFTAAPMAGAPWLHVTPTTASTGGAATVTISADATGLAAGVYTGTVVLSPPGTGGDLNVPVQLTVLQGGTGPGTLTTSASSVSFDAVLGLPIATQTMTVDSLTPGVAHPFTAAASSDAGWLTVDPFQATAPATLVVRANPAAIKSAGSYSGRIILTSLTDGSVINIPVTLTVQAKGIAADQTSLTFTSPDYRVAPPPQVLNISANTPAPSSFTILAPPWVRVSASTGATPAAVSVSVDPSALTPGVTSSTITITGPDNILSIPVSVTMPGPAAATVTPNEVSISYTLGAAAPAPSVLAVGSTNGQPLPFTAAATTADGGQWLSVAQSGPSAPATLSVAVDPSTLSAGTYSGTITVTSANGDVEPVPVTLNVVGTPSVQLVLHAATMTPTPIAPGLMIAIKGTGLGPVTGVSATQTSAGVFDTRLAGTRVLFDGLAAPVLFASVNQVNVVVPYGIYGRSSTTVQVETPGGASTAIDARVVDSAPGLFSTDGSGEGQAAALNENGTLNSTAMPAAPGTVVVLFGTGEGQTDPAGQDGVVIGSDLKSPLLPVSATVGGKPAEVVYFGSAPAQVSGVFQANVRIPTDVGPGPAAVRVQVGTARSQSNITVAVQ